MEAAVLAVAFGLLLTLAIAGGRLVTAEAAADHAARSAARVASLQRDPAGAAPAAVAAARASLDEQGLRCADLEVSVDHDGLAAPVGGFASVTATVRCVVDWSDLGLPAGAGGHDVDATAVSPIDRWRERP